MIGLLEPELLLPFLGDCLTVSDESRILAVYTNSGNVRATLELLQCLVRRKGFWKSFLKALKNPNIKQEHIADKLEADLQTVRMKPKAESGRNTCREDRTHSALADSGAEKESVEATQGGEAAACQATSASAPTAAADARLAPAVHNEVNIIMDGSHNRAVISLSNKCTSPEDFFNEYEIVDEDPAETQTPAPQRKKAASGAKERLTQQTNPLESVQERPVEARYPDSHEEEMPVLKTEVQRQEYDETPVLKPAALVVEKYDDLETDAAVQSGQDELNDSANSVLSGTLDKDMCPVVPEVREVLTLEDLQNQDIQLRGYQEELVTKPMEGDFKGPNCIVFAPPGSGKTVVAMAVCHSHLSKSFPRTNGPYKESEKNQEREVVRVKCKVVYLVPNRPFLEQVYKRLVAGLPLWKVGKKTGKSNLRKQLKAMLDDYDVLVCTPQILQNALEDGSVKITDLTLMIFDECHHTRDSHPYNMIMTTYLRKRVYAKEADLPQILGLTATPGTGGNDELPRVIKHLEALCANLDVTDSKCFANVRQPENVDELQRNVSTPVKELIKADRRKEDPFSDTVNGIMQTIETKVDIAGSSHERGSPQYASFIAEKMKETYTQKDSRTRKSLEYLTKYNRALELADIARMKDGVRYLQGEHEELRRRSQTGVLDKTELWLLQCYYDHEEKLVGLTYANEENKYPNPMLRELKKYILSKSQESSKQANDQGAGFRGIVFVKMVITARALKQWLLEDNELKTFNPEVLVGKGLKGGSSDREQKEIVAKFSEGGYKLLVSTSIGEEGIDFPDCTVSVRYDYVTDETSMIQSSGRARGRYGARATFSALIAHWQALARERENISREKLMYEGVNNLIQVDSESFKQAIESQQRTLLKQKEEKEKRQEEEDAASQDGADVKFFCRGCPELACNKSDLYLYNNTHRIIPSSEFAGKVSEKKVHHLQQHDITHQISCIKCDQIWGGKVNGYPFIGINHFEVEAAGSRRVYKKWGKVPGGKIAPFKSA